MNLFASDRPAGGADAEAPDQGKAFWLNSYIDNGTSKSLERWDGLLQYVDGLIIVDTETQTATTCLLFRWMTPPGEEVARSTCQGLDRKAYWSRRAGLRSH